MTKTRFPAFDDAGFDVEVASRNGLVLLDFWNEGCVPCRQLAGVLTELAPGLPEGVCIATVEASRNPVLVQRFNVRSVPTLVFVKNGTVVETRTGVDRRQVIKKIIETHA